MADPTTPITGGCLCGAVQFQITAKPLATNYCHCTMRQKQSDAPFTVNATVPFEEFRFHQGQASRL